MIGKVCVCRLGRVGLVTGRKAITFNTGMNAGQPVEMWVGIGFDGKGLWCASTPSVLCDSIEEYVGRIEERPNNVLYG